MSQISINDLTFTYEGSFDPVFEHATFSIDTNWKLGLIGRNGKGKTTFLNLMLGKYDYEGSIHTITDFDYFPYAISRERMKMPAAEFAEDLKTGCEIWKVICELGKLREDAELLYRPFESLSFGQQTKVLLAVLFSGENEFLLIDEPTNHLDREARESVKEYLQAKKGFILVSHDRDLLDACTDHCLVLNRNTIEVQNGNFSVWWENKKRRDQFAESENEKHQKEIHKLRLAAVRTTNWADKNESTKIGFDPVKEHDRCISTRSYIGAKTKKMQSRVKQMENRIAREIEEKEGLLQDIETTADLKLASLKHHKNTLIRLKDYRLRYVDAAGHNNPRNINTDYKGLKNHPFESADSMYKEKPETSEKYVLNGINFEINQGDRIALCGKNGCGKSSLIKMILQKAGMTETNLPIEENGICETASGIIISYICQDTGSLSGELSEFCKQKNLDKTLLFAILRQLDFPRQQFQKRIEEYSEGQKKKVLIAASLLTRAHLYIWDEPLNYIDVFSRMQIEKLLLTYKPTMLFVEHDIKFCEKIATRTIYL